MSEKQKVTNLPWSDIRLSPHIVPTHYQLLLHPDLVYGNFSGQVTITINVQDVEQDHVSIHIKGLKIKNSTLVSSSTTTGKTQIPLKECFEYAPNEFWVMVAQKTIPPGTYEIELEFEGTLTEKIIGFYRSTYVDKDNKTRYIATTKFEPTFARQAFPCFDEPNLKAEYDISMVKPSEKEYIALSNMNQTEEIANNPGNGLTLVKFARTKPMATYLACFILCDFKFARVDETDGGFPVTVYAREELIDQVHFAKEVAVKVSNFYLSYFKVPYPLPKLDLIAIPDFVSGAMENWGLITFRETRVLCDKKNSPASSQLDVALVVSHEIAHMWFGDLVTMKWWDDLWLNEGFATFIEYKGASTVYPADDLDGVFLLDEVHYALEADSKLSSHPIVMPVKNPDQITEIFDGISYSKGATVIRMLENTIGKEAFRNGIQSYLTEYAFKNAETVNLWAHLNKASTNGVDVQAFMETWTLQMGFPVVSVKVNRDQRNITFSQKRFLLDPEISYDKGSSPFGYKWEIPISYLTSSKPRDIQKAWLNKTQESVTVTYAAEGDESNLSWIKLNYHQYGYFIVNYDVNEWNELHKLLMSDSQIIDPIDRAGLLFDALFLAKSNQLPYENALNLTEYLRNEQHYVPWAVASKSLLDLLNKMDGTDGYDLMKSYISSLIDNKINWDINETSSYIQKSYQSTILNMGCKINHPKCISEVMRLFKDWIGNPTQKLHPELSKLILSYGAENSNKSEWNKLWDLYLKEQNPQKKSELMRALARTKDVDLIEKYLQLGKNESYVRSQDYLTVIMYTGMNPTANPTVWNFVRNEWPYLVSRYTLNDRYLGRVIPNVCSSFSTNSKLTEMNEFFQKYPEAGAGARARKSAIEVVNSNINWRLKNLQPIINWLKTRVVL